METTLTPTEMKKFRGILQAMVIELDRSTRQRDAIAIEKSAESLENRLRATDREFAMRKLEIESGQLREARAALVRIDRGTFGLCEECEEPIGARRLAAVPSAALCIRCKQSSDCDCAAPAMRPAFAMAA